MFGALLPCIWGDGLAYRDPSDFSSWEQFRTQVQHPAGIYRAEDVARLRQAVQRDEMAASQAQKLKKEGDDILEQITPEYLEEWICFQKGFGNSAPCPACRDKGFAWHPGGTWSWSRNNPDQLICTTCKTVYPNEQYPESIRFRSQWDPRQEFSYVGGEPQKCFGFLCRLSYSSVIRTRKMQSTFALMDTLNRAYMFTGDANYADGVRRILLRFAEVVPHYLFGNNVYGEVADCNPHVAVKKPFNLPTDEITPPPNKPDRKIHTGYWSGNRLGTSGQDGGMTTSFALAYDVTCTANWPDGRPVYSEAERYKIEKDLLLEMCLQFIYDKGINNKSVGGRAACAVVGCVTGHPDLVRYGLEGLYKTVNGWFLPDYTTPESGSYLSMVFSNIRAFPWWFRDYSEPEGYEPPDGGERLHHFNVFKDTEFGMCCQNAIDTLQGDLIYPPIADTHPKGSKINPHIVNVLPISCPTPRNLSFFKANNKGRITNAIADLMFGGAIDLTGVEEFTLSDCVYPYLQQGFLRYGPHGRDGLAHLNASDFGGHHHWDSLGLYLWHKQEVLSDLGYLWDHPDKIYTVRTDAHNLVMVDWQNQCRAGRGGSFSLFETAGPVKAMRASSKAYPQATTYERTVLQVDHGEAGFYWLDLFKVQGGRQRDYVFHGVNHDFTLEGAEKPLSMEVDKTPTVRFCIELQLHQLGTWEFSDVELYQIDADGKAVTENIAVEFPAGGAKGSKTCKGWGRYTGNGNSSWEPCEGKNGRGVRYSTLTIEENGKWVNQALVIGQCDGYRGPDALLGKVGSTYRFRFYARGDEGTFASRLLAFHPGEELVGDGRSFMQFPLNENQLGTEWKLYEGTFTLALKERSQRLVLFPAVLQKCERGAWKAVWRLKDNHHFAAFSPYTDGEELLYGDDWGQRFYNNSDRGATLPYFSRRRKGDQLDNFVTVFHSYFGDTPLVKDVFVTERPEGVVAVVQTGIGEDIFLFAANGQCISSGEMESDAEIAVVCERGEKTRAISMFQGTNTRCGEQRLSCTNACFAGTVKEVVNRKDEAYFVLEGECPKQGDWKRHTLVVTGEDGIGRPYQIQKSEWVNGTFRAYTRVDGMGLPVREGKSWLLPNRACAEF